MPESFDNKFTVDELGDIATSFVLLAGSPTQDSVINWGTVGFSFGGGAAEAGATIVHGLGVVPTFIALNSIEHNGGAYLIGQIRFDVPPDTLTANGWVTDMFIRAVPAGTYFHQWVAIG